MNAFRRISGELKSSISNIRLLSRLSGFESVLVFPALVVLFLNAVSGFGAGFGGLVETIAFWALMLGILLAYANLSRANLYLGLFGFSFFNAVCFFKSLVVDGAFLFSPLAAVVFFGWMGCYAVRQTSDNKADISD